MNISQNSMNLPNRSRFLDRHVLVSGGAAGVGAEAVRLFAAEGARVSIVDIQDTAGMALSEEIMEGGGEAIFVRADVSQADEVSHALSVAAGRFGTIDILFNHAGSLVVKPFLETTYADWQRLFAINVDSMYFMTQGVLPGMLAQGRGVIVNTSSVSAALATPMEVLYCTTKGACQMFTRSIATEYRDQNIRCNAVCPGFIRTNHGLREIEALKGFGVDVTEAGVAELQGRICEPVEIARAALFLASDDASFVNGETLYVDNGLMART
jgi:NAD(P)-dependent dehydrogenase (short-subunit alcohol dehydrogenase family)